MPPPLRSIAEQTEPASPTTEHSPLLPTINDQPPTQPPPVLALSPSLPSSTPPSPKRPLPHQVLDLLCLPYRKRRKPTTPPSPPPPPPPPASCTTRFPRRRRTSFDSLYHSFPPPVFTGCGQPRALDSRLYPELLTDEDEDEHEQEHTHEHASDADHHFWSARSHLWAEIVAAQRDSQPAHQTGRAATTPRTPPRPPPERRPHPQGRSNAPPHLSIRGGGGGGNNGPRIRLPDAQRLPSLAWYLAGGMGAPPTAGKYRAWRARERARIAEANETKGREGREGRGFWREVGWVLGGARAEGERMREGRRGRGGDGDGDGSGDSGASGSVAGGDGGASGGGGGRAGDAAGRGS
ncbi:hedgehog receptor activity [Xylographa opegraphella]|nr:hedgehog receptor activity [Xylographa opegraphella]